MLTHWTVDTGACSSRPRVRMATFTIVLSSRGAIAPRTRISASLSNAGSSRRSAFRGHSFLLIRDDASLKVHGRLERKRRKVS